MHTHVHALRVIDVHLVAEEHRFEAAPVEKPQITLAAQGGAQQPPPTSGMVLKKKAPVSSEILRVKLPRPQEATLSNGLQLMVLEDRSLPQISFQLIIPGAGGTQRLTRLVGPSKAKDLIFTGRFVKADEALAIGLVDRLVPSEEVYREAVAWAQQFSKAVAVCHWNQLSAKREWGSLQRDISGAARAHRRRWCRYRRSARRPGPCAGRAGGPTGVPECVSGK